MKYHIDTIPVWDALKEDCECILCTIEDKQQRKQVNFFLGDGVMQPDIRQMINKVGFCNKHYQMMHDCKMKLPLGLGCYTRLEYVKEDLDKFFDRIISDNKVLKRSGALECSEYIKDITATCAICEKIDENMKRYFFTFIHLWKTDSEFLEEFSKSKGFCLKHFSQLIDFAKKEKSDSITLSLAKDMAKLQKKNLQRLSEEVKFFNDKFDHRNVDKPWGTAKDALPRAINKLSGHTIKF